MKTFVYLYTMTKKETQRLKNFIKEYKGQVRTYQLYITTQLNEFVYKPHDTNKALHQLLTDDALLGVRFNHIKQINLNISTRYGVYYF